MTHQSVADLGTGLLVVLGVSGAAAVFALGAQLGLRLARALRRRWPR